MVSEADLIQPLEGDPMGRLYIPDERDENFPMSQVVPKEIPGVNYRYWNADGWWGDQHFTPWCVPFSGAHYVEDGPVTQPETPHRGYGRVEWVNGQKKIVGASPLFDIISGYNWMQRNDEWPGENYNGTSVRAAAKFLQKNGLISNYWWAQNVGDIVRAILTKGPVIVGTWWHRDMFYPDDEGFITPTGSKDGGHAYLLNGVNTDRGIFRIKNSWGRTWGKSGFAYIDIQDFSKLLQDYGEALLATAA